MAIHRVCSFLGSLVFGASMVAAQFAPLPGVGTPGAAFQSNVGQGLGTHAAVNNAGGTGAGGGSMADFASLMTLVQTVVEPDSWEALGGVGTMAPYPAGIVVDPSGLVRSLKPTNAPENIRTADLMRGLLPANVVDSDDWRDAAELRCVSLRRMMQTIAKERLAGKKPPEDLQALAGLSRISICLLTDNDLILAGPVGGFVHHNGWLVDQASGLPPMRLASLALGLTACRTGVPFGCTIDPKPESLQNAAVVAERVSSGQLSIGLAADALVEALGRQDIRVFGTSANHEAAWVMIEADRHMKQLALGVEPMPEGTQNYLQTIQSSGSAPPTDLLLRLWFTGRPVAARKAQVQSDTLIELAGVPLRLSGENELAMLSGERGNRVVEPTTQTFIQHFNDNWSSLQSEYPIYGALESIYQAAAVSQLWFSATGSPDRLDSTQVRSDHHVLHSAVVQFAALAADQLTLPTEVDSIAVMHRYRRRNQMHHLVLASGGVSIDPQALIPTHLVSYPPLAHQIELKDSQPIERWWWNAKVQ